MQWSTRFGSDNSSYHKKSSFFDSLNTWYLISVTIDETTFNYYNFGMAVQSGSKIISHNNFSKFRLGAWYDLSTNSRFLDGDIAELIVYNSALQSSHRETLEGYLAHKWDLTANLPADHPYKNNAP